MKSYEEIMRDGPEPEDWMDMCHRFKVVGIKYGLLYGLVIGAALGFALCASGH